jgi:pimeloyl-ACP methyl ester carboxylesterase
MRTVILLPGILMPAPLRYERLIAALGGAALGNAGRVVTKDLEIYAGAETPPTGYTLETEVDGLDRFADEIGAGRFHLYGHSAGGGIAIAYAARAPGRVLSLAVDEPASDFTPEDRAMIEGDIDIAGSSDVDLITGFVAQLLRAGSPAPPPPQGPPPPWMARRPAGIRAFVRALLDAKVDPESMRAYPGPVYYSHGTLSNERWDAMRDRLEGVYADFTAEAYEGLHHMNTSHMAEPDRVADRLRALWERAER